MSKMIILFNGPPRAGKDTAAGVVAALLSEDLDVVKFTAWVKDVTHRDLGLDCRHDAYELLKDVPLPDFGGVTPRQAYIATSTRLRREFGDDIVAQIGVDTMEESGAGVILNPDLGNAEEGRCVIERFPADRILLIRIHRKDHDFSKDCREWVYLDGVTSFDVENVSISDFQKEIGSLCADFLAGLDRVPAYTAG